MLPGEADTAVQLHAFLRGVHRAGADRRPAAFQPAGLLAKRGDLDELRTRADVGDRFAASELADLLAGHGDLDQAVQIERALADAGEGNAQRLAKLLTQQGPDLRRGLCVGVKPGSPSGRPAGRSR